MQERLKKLLLDKYLWTELVCNELTKEILTLIKEEIIQLSKDCKCHVINDMLKKLEGSREGREG